MTLVGRLSGFQTQNGQTKINDEPHKNYHLMGIVWAVQVCLPCGTADFIFPTPVLAVNKLLSLASAVRSQSLVIYLLPLFKYSTQYKYIVLC